MKRKRITAGAVAYALCGVVAFGHAAAGAQKVEDAEYAACTAKRDSICIDGGRAAISGTVAGMLWPLYLSWEIFS